MIHYLLPNSTIFSCISLRVNWQILSPMWRQNEYAPKVFLNDRDKSVEINSVRMRVARYTSIFCCRALHVPIERFLLLLVKRRKMWLILKHILFSCSLKKQQSSAFPCFEKAFPLKYSYSSYEHHHHRCCSDFFLREEAHFQWHITYVLSTFSSVAISRR